MKKIRISRLQNQLMWLLEEAGEETVGAIFNTIQANSPDTPPAAVAGEIDTAVKGLQRIEYVQIARATPGSGGRLIPYFKGEPEFEYDLSSWVQYDCDKHMWVANQNPETKVVVHLVLGENGEKFFRDMRRV